MQVNILTFGQIKEITGPGPILLHNVGDTDEVIQRMKELYPSISNAVYILAVDKTIITERTLLKENDTIAFLPPYSGG